MQDIDPEYVPVDKPVRPDLDLIADDPDIVFKCVGCGEEVISNPTDADMVTGANDRLEVAYEMARAEHTCPAWPHPDLEDLPLEPEPFEHREVGQPLRYILTDSEVTVVLVDPAIVGPITPIFDSQQAALMVAHPYRARVWRLEEVE